MHSPELFLRSAMRRFITHAGHWFAREQIGYGQQATRMLRVTPLQHHAIEEPAENGLHPIRQSPRQKGPLGVGPVIQHSFVVDDDDIAIADQWLYPMIVQRTSLVMPPSA